MRIGVDIDEVLAEMMDPLLEYQNKIKGTEFRREDIFSFDLWRVFGGTREDISSLFAGFTESDGFRKIKPKEGSIEGIASLAENHGLIALSARPHYLEDQTMFWLAENFPNKFSQFYLTGQFEKSNGLSKASLCKKLGINVMIEDSPHYALECADAGVNVLLLNYRWNESMAYHPNIQRVYSWPEIVEKISA